MRFGFVGLCLVFDTPTFAPHSERLCWVSFLITLFFFFSPGFVPSFSRVYLNGLCSYHY